MSIRSINLYQGLLTPITPIKVNVLAKNQLITGSLKLEQTELYIQ